jgi:hypothetical protein
MGKYPSFNALHEYWFNTPDEESEDDEVRQMLELFAQHVGWFFPSLDLLQTMAESFQRRH